MIFFWVTQESEQTTTLYGGSSESDCTKGGDSEKDTIPLQR